MIEIRNDGPRILSSTYWGSDFDRAGALYVSVNAGAFRLLLPRSLEPSIDDMRTAKIVVISRGPWPEQGRSDAIEVLFDDGSDAPFALHFGLEQIDRVPPDSESGRQARFSAWTRGPKMLLDLPGRYRRSVRLPDMTPWRVS